MVWLGASDVEKLTGVGENCMKIICGLYRPPDVPQTVQQDDDTRVCRALHRGELRTGFSGRS
jgi:hypothetical protein